MKGFTLIEILVVIVIIGMLMISTGGILTSSFKAKNKTETQRVVQNQAMTVMEELKKNVLDANTSAINCPDDHPSISFETKSGGTTTLICDEASDQISSISAEHGEFQLLPAGFIVTGCSEFASCDLSADSEAVSINFNFGLWMANEGVDTGANYQAKVAVR
jgi:prepilin-type N-terminal cleavage/methylation domain-containing protein